MRTFLSMSYLLICFAGLHGASLLAEDLFTTKVIPFMNTYCIRCHSTEKPTAELNLSIYKNSESVTKDFRQWQHVIKFMEEEDMPPPGEKEPAKDEREAIVKILKDILLVAAMKPAGDPGVILPRRLSNSEYNYTIRDLIGHDIQPTRDFPVDPAAGEGFDNTGEALVMTPSLLKKYLAAAQYVASHLYLKPSGFVFAPHPVESFADRIKLTEQPIIDFYQRHSPNYETYLQAAWQHLRTKTPVAELARSEGISAKYLNEVLKVLELAQKDDYLLKAIGKRWTALTAPDVKAFSASDAKALGDAIRQLSAEICLKGKGEINAHESNAPIKHIAHRKTNAAKRDKFNTASLSSSRAISINLNNPKQAISVYLSIHSAQPGDYVRFDKARIEAPKQQKGQNTTQSLRTFLEEHAPDQALAFGFGKHPKGDEIHEDSFYLKAPANIKLEFSETIAPLLTNRHLNLDAVLDTQLSPEGSVHVGANLGKALDPAQLLNSPPLLNPASEHFRKIANTGTAFCQVFPSTFTYVDGTRGLSAGFHLVEGFFRDDLPLCNAVLDDAQKQHLDRLWYELNFITNIGELMLRGFVFFERSERDFLKATQFDPYQEHDPKLIEPDVLNQFEDVYLTVSKITERGEQIKNHPIRLFFDEIRQNLQSRKETLANGEKIYLADLARFAERAWRRPLTQHEIDDLNALYRQFREQDKLEMEPAIRGVLTSILVSPYFCYRLDIPPPGKKLEPLSNFALASRLSYFLWSSTPDDELLNVAKAGKLQNEEELLKQTRRMLKNDKVDGFSLEFLGQWLKFRDFITQESIDRSTFPHFTDDLRNSMMQEPVQLARYLIHNDLPVTDLLFGKTSFVDAQLGQHYGISNAPQAGWKKVDDMQAYGRGGLLGMAIFLTKNSPGFRTSPVKRGFWTVHTVLGEHIPAPPADVPELPQKETEMKGKTVRQLLQMHVEVASCAQCHKRFDGIGLAMEGFDPTGKARMKDLGGQPVDNVVLLGQGKSAKGVPEYLTHLEQTRKKDFVRTLCKKFLGYALGRSLELSDEPFIEQLQQELERNGYRFSILFESVVKSPQFRNQRGRDYTVEAHSSNKGGG